MIDPIIGGALITAGSSFLGGMMNSQSTAKTNRLQMIQAQQQMEAQREFAQHGIRWKVADAKAAGIHPLAALGAQTQSYSPVSVGLTPDHSMGNAVSSMGQDIGRAISATRTEKEKTDAYTKTVQDLSLQKMGLENELLASQIAKINQAGTPPPFPGGTVSAAGRIAQGSPLIKEKPMERTATKTASPHQEPGPIPGLGWERTPKGYAPLMSNDVKERLEEDWPGMLAWNARNRIGPWFSNWAGRPVPQHAVPFAAPNGKEWFYNGLGELRLRKAPVQGPPIPRSFPKRPSYSSHTRYF